MSDVIPFLFAVAGLAVIGLVTAYVWSELYLLSHDDTTILEKVLERLRNSTDADKDSI